MRSQSHPGLLVAVAFSALTVLSSCSEPLATPEPARLRITGSTTMVPLLKELFEGFAQGHPSVTAEVTGGGTSFGLDALESGEADIALVSWLPADLDLHWQATAVARDGIAVIVHPSNTLDGLGLLQLRDLLSGRIYEWEAIARSRTKGSVLPISRDQGSGTRAAFDAMVMEDLSVAPRAVVGPSDDSVVKYVSGRPLAIGYVAMNQLTPDVKAIRVEGELPTTRTAGTATYPLTRELWLVMADAPDASAQVFVDFALGPVGQQIVGKHFGRIH